MSGAGHGVGVVAAGHPRTVEAAAEVLGTGGNAYDAVVAAGFAAAVVEPCLSSLAGGGFLLARTAAGEEVVFDFFVDTPGAGRGPSDLEPHFTPVTVRFRGADQIFNVGSGSIAVPGALAGYLHVHRRLGRLELDAVVAPARRMCEQGVALGPDQLAVLHLLEPIFTLTEEGRERYTRRGALVGPDDPVVNEPMAAFLTEVGAGRVSGFADPALSRHLDVQMSSGGGLLTAEDLHRYAVVEREPLVFGYRGTRVLSNPPPSFGASLVAHALAQLERAGPLPPVGSGARLIALLDVLDEITRLHTSGGALPGDASLDTALAEPTLAEPTLAEPGADGPPLRSSRGTTHVSVVDAEGNLASMTTSNGSCSGIFLGDTGVMANNIMGEADLHPAGFHVEPPGQRVGSMMAPSILLPPQGEPVVLGSGGSERIRSAIAQVLVHLIDDRAELAAAVRAPRVHWDGHLAQVEPGFDPPAVEQLRAVRATNEWSVRDLYFGGVHAVTLSGDCAGDPRRGGSTAVVT